MVLHELVDHLTVLLFALEPHLLFHVQILEQQLDNLLLLLGQVLLIHHLLYFLQVLLLQWALLRLGQLIELLVSFDLVLDDLGFLQQRLYPLGRGTGLPDLLGPLQLLVVDLLVGRAYLVELSYLNLLDLDFTALLLDELFVLLDKSIPARKLPP